MERSALQLAKVQYGFKKDCEKLLQDYARSRTCLYSLFATLWKEMKFSLVYKFSSTLEKITQHTELFLFEAKKYLIFGDNEFIKVGALYMLYGLYYKQPIKGYIKIRFTVSEHEKVLEFIKDMTQQQKAEPVYVFSKLRHDSAFDFVYTQRPLVPELSFLKECFKMEDDTFRTTTLDRIDTDMKKLISNTDIRNISDEYDNALNSYLRETNEESFMVCSRDLQKDIKQIMFGKETPIGQESEEVKDDIGERRIALKKKSAATTSSDYKVSKAELSPKKKKIVDNKK